MDKQLEERLSEAAGQFASAVKGSYQAAADRTVSAQQRNAELTQDFFKKVINNLRNEAARNRQVTQELAGQQQRATEAAQTLAQESTNAYIDFLNSMFSFYQGNTKEVDRHAEESEIRHTEDPEGSGGETVRDRIKETIRRSRGEV